MTTLPSPDCIYRMKQLRLNDFKLTHPLLLTDIPNESPHLNTIKEKINHVIAAGKSSGKINDISVYYRNLNDGSWFEINGDKTYQPASLMKVPLLMTILKQSVNNRALLDKKVFFGKHFTGNYNQNIKTFQLTENKQYTIKELLRYMIEYSDNDAMSMIAQNIEEKYYNKLFTDLGIPVPPPLNSTFGVEYSLNIVDYSKFFRLLYSSAYLNDDQSEFALELLTKCNFNDGLLKKIGGNFPVAHKFGERVSDKEKQLHEVGIFYADKQPYLLGVMSSGRDLNELSTLLGEISQITSDASNKGN